MEARCSPAKKRSTKPVAGCPTKRSTPFATCWSASRARSPRPWAAASASLNVALRQMLDLYVCLRPVQYFTGVPSPVKHPEQVDMVIFRENTEDIYAGIEYAGATPQSQKVLDFLAHEFPKEFAKIRFGTQEKNDVWQTQLAGIGAPARLAGRRGHRLQAGQLPRDRAAGAQRDRLCHQVRPQERDAGAQRQHHEVHRRRVSATGATRWPSSSTAPRTSTAARGR